VPRVLVAGKIHQDGLSFLKAAPGFEIDYVEEVSTESYAPLIGDADAVLIRTQPMPAEVIGQARRLRIVSRHGVGYDAIDVAALTRRGLPLAIVGDVNSRAVAEHTMLLILATAKRLLSYDASVRTAHWGYRDSLEASELDGKRLLIVGFGRIGRHVARMASAFGLYVLAFDPFVPPADIRAAGAEPVSDLAEALATADIVTIHTPKTGGEPLIGAGELARMKPSAIIINTARGGIVDEAALTAALRAGRLAGAGLDVFESEPPAADRELLKAPNAVLTPHSASMTAECASRMAVAAAKNIVDFFAGQLDPSLVVNLPVLAGRIGEAAGERALVQVPI
jgi:D-3-phosphoglycerate dehydrogenase